MESRDHSPHYGLDGLPASVPSLNSLLASISSPLMSPPSPHVYPGSLMASPTAQMFGADALHAGHEGLPSPTSWMTHPADHLEYASAPIHSLFDSAPAQPLEDEPRRRSRRVAARAAREAISSSSSKRAERISVPCKKRAVVKSVNEDAPQKRARHEEDGSLDEFINYTKPPPNAKDDAKYGTDKGTDCGVVREVQEKCCICITEPEHEEISAVNSCDHRFCFDCIAKWGERENTCPLCKLRFTKISRVHRVKRRNGGKTPANTKHVRERNQRSDLVSGAALEAMLNSIAASNRASLGGSALGPSRVGRFVFAMGSGSGGTRRVHFAPSSRRAALYVEENLLESDEDSSDGGLTLPVDFNELMRQTMTLARRRESRSRRTPFVGLEPSGFHTSHPLGAAWVVPPAPSIYGLFHQQQPAAHQRSYAVNMNDTNAGRAAENPLEIDDSDDDDDDVVEVIVPP